MPRLTFPKSHETVARRIFFAFLLSAGLPLGLLAGWTLLHVDDHLTDQAGQRARELAKIHGTELLGRLNAAVNELKTLATLDMSVLRQLAPNWIKIRPDSRLTHWDVLFAIGSDGRPTLLAGEADRRLSEVAERRAPDTPDVVGQLVELPETRTPAAKRHHYLLVSSSTAGWIGGRLNPDYLWDLEQLLERADVLCYLDEKGSAFACSETPSNVWLTAMRHGSIEGREGWSTHDDGEKSMVGAVWPFVMGQFLIDQEWSVMIGIPVSKALAPVALFRAIFPQVTLITLALVGLLSLYVIRGNLRPLAVLLQATRRVKTGSFDVTVSLPRRDEFQELGHAFNDMTQALSRQFRYLAVMAELGRELQERRSVRDTLNGFLRTLPTLGSFHAAGALALPGTEPNPTLWVIPIAERPGSAEPISVPLDTDIFDLESKRWLGSGEAAANRYSALHLLGPMPKGQCLVLPATNQGRVLANLVLIYAPGLKPEDEELLELERVANFLGVALQKALLHDQLVYRAERDLLTGLASRAFLIERLERKTAQQCSIGNELALVMVYVDNLRSIGETHGYVYSDLALVEIGRRLRDLIRDGENLSRFDGGNFVALLQAEENQCALDRAAAFIEGIDSALSTTLFVEGREFRVSATKGGAIYPLDCQDSTGLLRRADAALQEARRSDCGGVRWFDAGLERRIEQRHQAEQALHYAIQRNELDLYYQPISDASDGTIVGAEALLRWQRPGFGVVSPDVFIPLAEETGLIEAIGLWTLRRACHDFRTWRRRGLTLPYISVNVSGRQLVNDAFAEQVEAIVVESGVPPENLVLEVTETAMIGRLDACFAQIEAVRRFGIRVAIDDFGTGYASLKYVKELPADIFKIDRLFVSGLPNNARDLAIVSTVQLLARELGAELIAEGVESADQVKVLAEQGIRKLQGYFYSKPLPKANFISYMTLHLPAAEDAASIG